MRSRFRGKDVKMGTHARAKARRGLEREFFQDGTPMPLGRFSRCDQRIAGAGTHEARRSMALEETAFASGQSRSVALKESISSHDLAAEVQPSTVFRLKFARGRFRPSLTSSESEVAKTNASVKILFLLLPMYMPKIRKGIICMPRAQNRRTSLLNGCPPAKMRPKRSCTVSHQSSPSIITVSASLVQSTLLQAGRSHPLIRFHRIPKRTGPNIIIFKARSSGHPITISRAPRNIRQPGLIPL